MVELDEPDCDRLEGAARELAELGLEIERFGPSAMLVRSVPAALASTDVKRLLADLAAEIAELGSALGLRDRLDLSRRPSPATARSAPGACCRWPR